MDYLKITKDNIASEHICCAISNNRDCQVASKKAWLMDRLDEGLVFLKADARGKCFIEYIPAEYAWVPIEANGYMHVNCLWVSGQFAGHGYSSELLKRCIDDSREKGMKGLSIISSPKKKQAFLSDPEFLAHKGFLAADEAAPFFTLMYLPFEPDAPVPSFKPHVKHPHAEQDGYAVYYTHGCPFTAKYVPVIEDYANSHGIPFTSVLLDTREKAQNAPAAWTNYAVFKDGEYVTNEVLSIKKFEGIVGQ